VLLLYYFLFRRRSRLAMTLARSVVLVSRIHVYCHEKVEQLRYSPDYLDWDRVKVTIK